MKTEEIWKVNCHTFMTEKDAHNYCIERNFKVTDKEISNYKNTIINLWNVTNLPENY